MKILIIANNCKWKSWHDKIDDLQDWFKPKVKIDFDLKHTEFNDIPFSDYFSTDGVFYKGVDNNWYDKNLVIPNLGGGYDMILFVVNNEQWQDGRRVRGWRTDNDQGPVQLQVAANEKEKMKWPEFKAMNAFFQIARHEICHGLFMISNQADSTHYWWDRGQLEKARDEVRLPKDYKTPRAMKTFNYLQGLLKSLSMSLNEMSPGEKIYNKAKSLLGTDASPMDKAPDGLGCAETVSTILNSIWSYFRIVTGTWSLYDALRFDPKFVRITNPDQAMRGDIFLFVTGMGNGKISNGHVGFLMDNNMIASNDSGLYDQNLKGKFVLNYTVDSFIKRFRDVGGYELFIYRALA